MSVINQMLKDLERRKADAGASGDAVLHGLHGADAASRGPRFGPIAAIALGLPLLAVAGWYGWQQLKQTTPHRRVAAAVPAEPAAKPPARPQPAALVAAKTPVAKAPPAPAAVVTPQPVPPPAPVVAAEPPARVAAIEVAHTSRRTRITFNLNRKAGFAVQHDAKRGRLELDLSDTRLATALPELADDQRMFHAVYADEVDGTLKVSFELAPKVRIQSYALAADDAHPERVVLELYPPRAPAPAAKPAPKPQPLPKAKPAVAAKPATPAPAPKPVIRKSAPGESLPAAAPADEGQASVNKHELPLTPAQKAQASYQRAMALLQDGNTTAAEQALRDALIDDPAHRASREALATLLSRAGGRAEARQVLASGVAANPHDSRLAELYAHMLVEDNDIAQAADVLAAALPSAARNPQYHAFLAALDQRLERHAEAVKGYRRALAVRPQQGVWWMGLGISLRALGRNQEAAAAFRRALLARDVGGNVRAYVEGQLRQLEGVR